MSHNTNGQEITPDLIHAIVAGALFDFMGWLTTLENPIVLSSSHEAGPAVEAIKEFAEKKNLNLDGAAVLTWQNALGGSAKPTVGE